MQEIICILDGSGSMVTVKEEAKNGFNKFIEEQQKIGEANLTVVWFDNIYEVAYEGKLSEMKPLESWRIGGWTALYDAVGKTFNHVKDRFSREKPEKVIMAIQTDGEENASKEYTRESVSSLIKEHEDKYAWDVIFLGAGLETKQQATNLGIKLDKTFIVGKSGMDLTCGFDSYSSSVAQYRT